MSRRSRRPRPPRGGASTAWKYSNRRGLGEGVCASAARLVSLVAPVIMVVPQPKRSFPDRDGHAHVRNRPMTRLKAASGDGPLGHTPIVVVGRGRQVAAFACSGLFMLALLCASLALQRIAPQTATPSLLTGDQLFEVTKIWRVHLSFTPEQWKALEPPGGPGPFGGPGTPGGPGPPAGSGSGGGPAAVGRNERSRRSRRVWSRHVHRSGVHASR